MVGRARCSEWFLQTRNDAPNDDDVDDNVNVEGVFWQFVFVFETDNKKRYMWSVHIASDYI